MNLRGKNILITGSDGFIGSHLTEALIQEGCNVRAFVFYNSFNSWGWLDSLPKENLAAMEIMAGDIRDPNGVRKAVYGVDIVFHLAALIGIPFSYHSPDSYVDTNIKGALNVLQAARDHHTEKVIITSTSEVYGSAEYIPIDEKHPFKAQSPYSATKIAADRLAESFYRSFATPVVIARPFNAYGPRQSLRAVIPTIITQVINGNKSIELGSLIPTRDFNYVKDVCKGFIEIAKSDSVVGEEINIASGKEISIGNLVKKITDKIGADVRIVSQDDRIRPQKSEVERLIGSNEKIRRLTNWKPEHDLERGLSETIRWFSETVNVDNYKRGIYNI